MNYTRTKDFAAADALPTGNAAKAIKGFDFGLEFDNLATAIATKVDTSGDAALNSLAMTGAAGGSKGAGTVNATALYLNGVVLPTIRNNAFGTGTAPLNCSAITVGDTYTVFRSANNSIASNATPAVDPVLQFTNLPAGTYRMSGFAEFISSAGSIGISFGLNNTSGTVAGSQVTNTYVTDNTAASSNQAFANSLGFVSAASARYSIQQNATFVVTAAATVGFFWAQGSSSATPMVLQAGSNFSITRVL